MSIQSAVQEIEKEIARLQNALSLLVGGTDKPLPPTETLHMQPRKKFTLSPASRKKMADAQKKRWAARKAAAPAKAS